MLPAAVAVEGLPELLLLPAAAKLPAAAGLLLPSVAAAGMLLLAPGEAGACIYAQGVRNISEIKTRNEKDVTAGRVINLTGTLLIPIAKDVTCDGICRCSGIHG